MSMFSNVLNAFETYLNSIEEDKYGVSEHHLLGIGSVGKFEQKLSAYYDLPYCISFNNATNALFVVVHALGLTKKEILTTPFCYGASVSPFLFFDNTLSIIDVEDECHNPNYKDFKACVGDKSAAFLGVDYCGIPQNTTEIRKYCDEHGLLYIADAAQSFGASIDGNPASYMADVVIVSFTAGKTMFCGEGGAILTRDKGLYEKILWYSQHPKRQKMELGLHKFNEFNVLNGRMNPFSAIVGSIIFEDAVEATNKKSKEYLDLLDELTAEGAIEKTMFRASNLLPSFYYLTAKAKGALADLERRLSEKNILCQNLPYDMITNNPLLYKLFPNKVKKKKLKKASSIIEGRYELIVQ